MLEPTDTLWRYMKLETLLLLLTKRMAWFPSVASLRASDPFEGALGEGFHRELWKRIESSNHDIEAMKSWLFNSLPAEIQGLLKLNKGYSGLSAQELGKAYSDALAQRRTAWCWFDSSTESAAMWQIYGCLGVAVESDRNRLDKTLKEALSNEDFSIDSMNYVDHRSGAPNYVEKVVRDNPELLLRPHFLKRAEYAHEKELRVVTFCSSAGRGRPIHGINPNTLIREIRISPLLPAEEADSIISQITTVTKGMAIHVAQSDLTVSGNQIGLANALSLPPSGTLIDTEDDVPEIFKIL